jgi:hypothetical protein
MLTKGALKLNLRANISTGGVMKVFAKFLFVSVMVAMLAGCASDNAVFIPKVPPHAQAKLLDYFAQPDNKVFVLAVDPSGDYAFGYDYGKETLKEAAKVAVTKCDENRETHRIVAKPYIYAVNNKVVYEEMIIKAHQAKKQSETKAQEEEVARQEATGEANQPAAE